MASTLLGRGLGRARGDSGGHDGTAPLLARAEPLCCPAPAPGCLLLHRLGLAQLGAGKRGFCWALVPCRCWWQGQKLLHLVARGLGGLPAPKTSPVQLLSARGSEGMETPQRLRAWLPLGCGDVLWGRLFLAPRAAGR